LCGPEIETAAGQKKGQAMPTKDEIRQATKALMLSEMILLRDGVWPLRGDAWTEDELEQIQAAARALDPLYLSMTTRDGGVLRRL